jgi:CRISPR system Cascade subunit CasD
MASKTTLLLNLSAPMQSWGIAGGFDAVHPTAYEPTKSGVCGLIAAALGRPKSAHIEDVASLRMGVRVDQPGIVDYDFQVIQDALRRRGGHTNVISNRYYLADASFLVGLEGEAAFLRRLNRALHNPRWPLFLGRRRFVPSEPVCLPDGLQNALLLDALGAYPWLGRVDALRPARLRLIYDDPAGDREVYDYPMGRIADRRFAPRRVSETWMAVPHEERRTFNVSVQAGA